MQGTVDERLAAAGGVNDSLVEAFRSLLNGEHLQGLVVPCAEVGWRLCVWEPQGCVLELLGR